MTSWTQVNAINIKIVVSDDFVNAPEKKKQTKNRKSMLDSHSFYRWKASADFTKLF